MTNQTHEFFFEFPAIQCQQGGRVQYMLCAPMNMLKRIMAFDDAGDVMSRSQREVHLGRAKKINRYLTTDTIKCDTPAQNRAAEKLLNVFGMSTEHPHAWLRTSFDEDVSDEQVAEMAEKIAKVAEEKKLDLAMLKTALPERLALSETPMKPVFANMRRLRAWMSEQFPLPEQQ